MTNMFHVGDRVKRVLHGLAFFGTVVGVFDDIVFVQWDGGELTVLDEAVTPYLTVVYSGAPGGSPLVAG